ncbi:SPJ_0845 family protein [Lacticaseibacillus hegangensis]|uniref:SPJ_0845 family protein n=1 Tax=Lacticaseibacillus hegangensis TaxID=2486010 RepID=A0ABW4D0F7_9LACO|nr:SPJ_0845 family protein [Lacticaseibacillus hegangensis]
MGLKVNTKNDWGEMFDKFATIPEAAKAAGPDPKAKEKADKAKAAKDKAKK